MIPLLIIIVVACLTAGATACFCWNDIIKLLKGKKICVMGDRLVGKTSLIEFFEKGTIPESYTQTNTRTVNQAKPLKLKDLELVLKRTMDYGGDAGYYSEWKKLYLDADIIFYLLRADKILLQDDDTESRVTADLLQIRSWKQGLGEAHKRRPFFIIGTYCDQDPEFQKLKDSNAGSYADKFRRLPIIEKLRALARNDRHPVRIILGSTLTKESTEALALQILTGLQEIENS